MQSSNMKSHPNKNISKYCTGLQPSEELRRMEIAANDAFDQYREQYYEVSECARSWRGHSFITALLSCILSSNKDKIFEGKFHTSLNTILVQSHLYADVPCQSIND
jgi:hypothetical protein